MFGLGKKKEAVVLAPVGGAVKPVSALKDETFQSDMLGRGIAIEPVSGHIAAPADGTLSVMFNTGHAACIVTDGGAELLVHIGIDTVQLKGKYFTKLKQQGDRVKAGEPLIECDLKAIAAEGYDTVTVVIVLNPKEFGEIRFTGKPSVRAGDKLIWISPAQ